MQEMDLNFPRTMVKLLLALREPAAQSHVTDRNYRVSVPHHLENFQSFSLANWEKEIVGIW